ncbi:MAG: AAA-like domain-containing protein [Cyanobacteria bacterium P01_D01_bin.44]
MAKRQSKQRRKRGVLLSPTGWQRLQAAERKFESQENQGNSSTLEILSEKTKLSPNTITKVRRRQAAVDRQTLEAYFKAFDLPLAAEDYQSIETAAAPLSTVAAIYGQVALDSPLYISRLPLETLCYTAMVQPGAFLHIRGPQQSGKTSLITHALAQVRQQGLNTQMISCRLVDGHVASSFEGFLRWFCAAVTRRLGLPDRLDDLWNPNLGNSFNCTSYFEQYLLEQLSEGLVLVLDDIDGLFQFPGFTADFLNMLRTWHEMARYGDGNGQRWSKLRLVLLHSPGGYAFESPSMLPVNFGTTLDLPNFSQAQIASLIERYGFSLDEDLPTKLMHFLGGKPNLVQLTLHTMQHRQMPLEQITQSVTSPDSIFADHLLYYCNLLNQYPILKDGIRQIVQGKQPVLLAPMQALHLLRLGLITCEHQSAYMQCQLYQDYFEFVLR